MLTTLVRHIAQPARLERTNSALEARPVCWLVSGIQRVEGRFRMNVSVSMPL